MSGEALVIGGGIGGLTTALAMAQHGQAVRVLERSEEFAEIGAGLQLAPNATRVLRRLGVLDEVLDVGVLPQRLVLNDALDGRELTELPLGDFSERYGGPYVVLHRGDLLDILVRACARHVVALETRRHVTGVETAADRVVVACSDGERYEGIVAVGADGLWSTTRSLVSDDQPVCSGYVAYRGAIPIEQATRKAELTEVAGWIGPGMHFVQYPLRRGRLYNQVAVFRSERYAAGHEDWGTPEELDAAFASACDHVREALPTLWRHQRWPMYDREPIDHWIAGRVVLLGDAAHPMLQYLAQGACQAMEDAVTLADALDRHREDWAAGLAAYQDERLPRTRRVQQTARMWGDMWHVDGVSRVMRNELFRQRRPDDHRHVEWLYG